MTAEFDYQWRNLPDHNLDLTPKRIEEFLDYVQLPAEWFEGKLCLDAGCGTGRWTWVMIQLGANVTSIDKSLEAVAKCKAINSNTLHADILDLNLAFKKFDFVFSWGVLHHLSDPLQGFLNLSHCVKPGGYLHIMVYHKSRQLKYFPFRKLWRILPGEKSKRLLCKALALGALKSEHGWWDALNPRHNHGFYPRDIEKWFMDAGFRDVTLTRKFSINMRGRKR